MRRGRTCDSPIPAVNLFRIRVFGHVEEGVQGPTLDALALLRQRVWFDWLILPQPRVVHASTWQSGKRKGAVDPNAVRSSGSVFRHWTKKKRGDYATSEARADTTTATHANARLPADAS